MNQTTVNHTTISPGLDKAYMDASGMSTSSLPLPSPLLLPSL